MSTNLALDDKLIDEARLIGGHKSKKAAVTAALEEYIQRRKQLEMTRVFGKIEFDPAYDHKTERSSRKR